MITESATHQVCRQKRLRKLWKSASSPVRRMAKKLCGPEAEPGAGFAGEACLALRQRYAAGPAGSCAREKLSQAHVGFRFTAICAIVLRSQFLNQCEHEIPSNHPFSAGDALEKLSQAHAGLLFEPWCFEVKF